MRYFPLRGASLFIYLPYFIPLFSAYPPFFLSFRFWILFFVLFFPQLRNWNNNKKKGGLLLFVRSTGHLSHPFPILFFFIIIFLLFFFFYFQCFT